MKIVKIGFLGVFLFTTQIITAQGNGQDSINTAIDTIQFELTTHNNIAIKAILNEMDTLNMMFHTAANDVTLIKEVTKKLTSIHWDETDKVKSWGGENDTRFSKYNTLQINHLKWDSVAIWENENSGPTTDGKFGPDLFQGKVIEIDFDKRILILYKTLPKKVKEYEKLKLIFEADLMFLEGISQINGVDYPNKFLIHSGYGGAILYDDAFVAQSKIGAQITITEEKALKDSYGNVIKTKKGKLPVFKIGAVEWKDIPVGFFEGALGRQQMSVMGGNLLKRFNIIIDAQRENIYIKPNQLKDSPYVDP